jgi:integral membrane protein
MTGSGLVAPDRATGAAELEQLRRLRLAALVEGVTLVLLVLVAVPAKHLFGVPALTKVMGPVHGLAFVGYVWMLLATVSGGSWRLGEILRLMTAAFVPFGAFHSTRLLRRKEAALAAVSSEEA